MKLPGMGLIRRAERTGNEVEVPMTERLGLVDFVKQVLKEAQEDHLSVFAGHLTYSGLFAVFPFMVFLLSLLGIFRAEELVNELLSRASTAMPREAVDLIGGPIRQIAQSKATGAFGLSALVSILLALWGVSGAFRSVMEAMNVMYEVKEGRPFWKRYLISILLSLGAAVLIIAALVLVVFGADIATAIARASAGLGPVFRWTWIILQWPVLVGFVLLAFALIYYFAPDVEQQFRFITPGSLVAVALWLVFSLLFSLYVNNFGSYNKTYGALAGVIILMLYMYYSAYILLLGTEINQVIEEHAPGGKQEGEKAPGEAGHPAAGPRPGDREGMVAMGARRGPILSGVAAYLALLVIGLVVTRLRR